MVYSGTLLYKFSVGWSLDYFRDTVQDLVCWLNSARKSGCSSSIVTPEPPQQNVSCLLCQYAHRPISWWRPFPEGGRTPRVCCLPLARSSLRDFCWSLLKLCYQQHGLKGTSCLLSELRYFSILRVDITFNLQRMRSSGNPPTLSDPFHWLSPSLQEALLVYAGRE